MAALQLEWINQLAGVEVTPDAAPVVEGSLADIDIKKGALHRKLGIPEDQTIPMEHIDKELSGLHAKSELSADDEHFRKMLTLAKTFKSMKKEEVEAAPVETLTEEDQLAALAGLVEHLKAEGYEIPEDMTVLELVQEICDNPDLTEEVEWLAEHGLVEYEELAEAPSLADGPMITPVAQMVMSEWFTRVSGNELVELDNPSKPPKTASPGTAQASTNRAVQQAANKPYKGYLSQKPKGVSKPVPAASLKVAKAEPVEPAKKPVVPSTTKAGSQTPNASPIHTKPSEPAPGAGHTAVAAFEKKPNIFHKAGNFLSKHLNKLGDVQHAYDKGESAKKLAKLQKEHEKTGSALATHTVQHKQTYGESYYAFAAGVTSLMVLLENDGYALPDDLTAQGLFTSVAQTPELAVIAAEPNYRQLVELGSSLVESDGVPGPLSAIPVIALVSDSAAQTLETISVIDLLAAWETNPIQEGVELSEEDAAFVAQMETLDDLMGHLQTEGYDLPADLTLEGLFAAVAETPELAWLLEDADYQALTEKGLLHRVGGALKHVGMAAGAAGLAVASTPLALGGLAAYGVGHLAKKLHKGVKEYKKARGRAKEASGEADVERAQREAANAAAHIKHLSNLHASREAHVKEIARHDAAIAALTTSTTPTTHQIHGSSVPPGGY